MNTNRRGFVAFHPIQNFMLQFNDVLRATDFTPGYIDTNHAEDCVLVMGVSEQFEEVTPGTRTPEYVMMVTEVEGEEGIESVQFLPIAAPGETTQ